MRRELKELTQRVEEKALEDAISNVRLQLSTRALTAANDALEVAISLEIDQKKLESAKRCVAQLPAGLRRLC